jgi:hypothetical protein
MSPLSCDTERLPDSQIETSQKERKRRRIDMACRMFFFGDQDFEGEATVQDVSTSDCRVISQVEVKVGMVFKLSLFLPDYTWPVRVEESIVRWVKGDQFGLEFTDIRMAQRERVRALIMKTRT